jgi:hypothetical protein
MVNVAPRLVAGYCRQAARRGLDGHEQGAPLDLAGIADHVLPTHRRADQFPVVNTTRKRARPLIMRS